MSIQFKFDPEKALEVILYIAEHAPQSTLFYLSKILYYADRLHLSKYGRFICGDRYIAMKNGPVPSGVYTILTDVRDDSFVPLVDLAKETFQVVGYNVKPTRKCDTSFLSNSDLKCLNEAIKEYGSLPFDVLSEKSHDEIYNEADLNDEIPVETIIKHLPNSQMILEYLNS